jgi:tetratricopeptide (TPR) repeat protein
MRLTALLITAMLAGSSDNERAMRMLGEWIIAVDRHAPGDSDAALERVAAWSIDDLALLRGYVEVLSDLPNDSPQRASRRRAISGNDMAAIRMRTKELQARGDFNAFLKRAAILHTDAALLDPFILLATPPPAKNPRSARQRDEPERIVDVISADGRVESYKIASPNWQIAMDLLEALPAKPARDPIVAQWYRAIGAYFAKQDNRADAIRHFDRARRVVPDDPGVLYGEACLQETLGSPDIQNFARLADLPGGMVITGVEAPQSHFRRAEALLKRALAAKPDFVEARLRLGHVLVEQKEFEAALPHLGHVVREAADPLLIYYAHLFAGDAAFALGRLSESQASYERAIASHPESQAARLGLAAALRAAGNREAALDAAMATLTVEPGTRDSEHDPWWEYYNGDAANVEHLMRELRASIRGRTP